MVKEIAIATLGVTNVITIGCLCSEKKKYKSLKNEHIALNNFASGELGYNALEAMFEYMEENEVGLDYFIKLNDEKEEDQKKQAKKTSGPAKSKAQTSAPMGNPVLQ